jgi:hypothetical protein
VIDLVQVDPTGLFRLGQIDLDPTVPTLQDQGRGLFLGIFSGISHTPPSAALEKAGEKFGKN